MSGSALMPGPSRGLRDAVRAARADAACFATAAAAASAAVAWTRARHGSLSIEYVMARDTADAARAARFAALIRVLAVGLRGTLVLLLGGGRMLGRA